MMRMPFLLIMAAAATAASAPAQLPLPRPPQFPQADGTPIVKQLRPGTRERQSDQDVPTAYRPPAGMCRVWLKDVPAGQQPAVTDCASAVRNRPSNGRVLFGDDYVDTKGDKRSPPRESRDRRPRPDSGSADARHNAVSGVGASGRSLDTPIVLATWVAVEGAGQGAVAQPPREERARDQVLRERQRERERRRIAAERRAGRRGGGGNDGRVDRDARDDEYDDVDDDEEYGRRANRAGAYDRVIVLPPGSDPRYFDSRYPPPGRANGTCLDRDRDGWCDDPRYGAPVCLDRDGDGRCDDYAGLSAAPYASSLPFMRAGADVLGGRGSGDALRWLGTSEVIARVTDINRDGVPERIQWLDANNGQLVQTWSDRNRDGVADRVEVYRNGRRVKLFGR